MQSIRRRRIPGQVGGRRYFSGGPAFIVHEFRGNLEYFGSIPRGLIRRQILSSSGQVFRRRMFVGGQGLTIVTTHIRGTVETTARLQHDYPGQAETVRNLLGDIVGGIETTSVRRVDSATELEFGGALTIASQGIGQLEVTALLSTDRPAPIEFGTGVNIDRVAQIESLFRVSHEVVGNLENLFQTMGHIRGTAEFLASSLINSVSRIEALTSQRSEAISQVESLGLSLIIANILAPLEITTSVTQYDIGLGQIEFLQGQRFDRAGTIEYLGQSIIQGNALGALEYLSTTVADHPMPSEWLARAQFDAVAMVESLLRVITDQRAPLEAPAAVASEGRTQLEFLVSRLVDAGGQIEMSVQHHIDIAAPFSILRQINQDAHTAAEFVGSVASISSSGGFIEILSTIASESSASTESSSLIRLNVAGGPIEYVAGVRVDAKAFTEVLASFLADWTGPLETLTSVVISFDMLANLEIAGFGIGFSAGMAMLESGTTVRIDIAAPIEKQATITLDTQGMLEEGIVLTDLTTLNLSIGRARMITVPYTSADLPPFDPLRVGEIDVFAFDFTPDVGAATIASTSWTCTLQPSPAIDSAPQARVITVLPATQLFTNSPIANEVQVWNGAFSVAILGTCPPSAAGGNYVLEATVILSDRRVLRATTSVLCVAANVH